ncbi:MAG: hypothetical protein LQ337_001965 [Flavoplaca oasis]|nr:MAG: hypothetical protein LQ337_001965 [Flavoplaca oasis]
MTASKKRRKPLLLSHTRPPSTTRVHSLSSHATRSLIRKHHTLQKQLHTATFNGDRISVERLQAEVEASGGLQKYQEASIQGQSSERGGDSSKVLIEWINDLSPQNVPHHMVEAGKLRMLEVGALTVDNACSRSALFDVTRIDLHSQHPGIKQQNFMQRLEPSPESLQEDGYDIVSLSLVLNYIGDAISRGEMLKRVSSFLRSSKQHPMEEVRVTFPALFLVLPAPCVTNSRYMDEKRLEGMMISMGYVKTRRKLGKKLIYYLWRYDEHNAKRQLMKFRKQEIRPGGKRNNFSIVLQ